MQVCIWHGAPANLLSVANSAFHKLAQESGKLDLIKRMAGWHSDTYYYKMSTVQSIRHEDEHVVTLPGPPLRFILLVNTFASLPRTFFL